MDWGDKVLVGMFMFAGALIATLVVGAILEQGNQRECRVKVVTEQHVTAVEAERICK